MWGHYSIYPIVIMYIKWTLLIVFYNVIKRHDFWTFRTLRTFLSKFLRNLLRIFLRIFPTLFNNKLRLKFIDYIGTDTVSKGPSRGLKEHESKRAPSRG